MANDTRTGILGSFWGRPPAFSGGILDGVQLAQAPVQDDMPISSTIKENVPQPRGQARELLQCMERYCPAGTIGRVTSTSDSHGPGNPHTDHQAIDITTDRRRQAMICGANCGAKFQLDEYAHPSRKSSGPHIHLQTRPGRGGATGPYFPPPPPAPRPEDYR